MLRWALSTRTARSCPCWTAGGGKTLPSVWGAGGHSLWPLDGEDETLIRQSAEGTRTYPFKSHPRARLAKRKGGSPRPPWRPFDKPDSAEGSSYTDPSRRRCCTAQGLTPTKPYGPSPRGGRCFRTGERSDETACLGIRPPSSKLSHRCHTVRETRHQSCPNIRRAIPACCQPVCFTTT